MRGKHTKLGEGCQKVRLGQDSLPNKPFPQRKLAESRDIVLPVHYNVKLVLYNWVFP